MFVFFLQFCQYTVNKNCSQSYFLDIPFKKSPAKCYGSSLKHTIWYLRLISKYFIKMIYDLIKFSPHFHQLTFRDWFLFFSQLPIVLLVAFGKQTQHMVHFLKGNNRLPFWTVSNVKCHWKSDEKRLPWSVGRCMVMNIFDHRLCRGKWEQEATCTGAAVRMLAKLRWETELRLERECWW